MEKLIIDRGEWLTGAVLRTLYGSSGTGTLCASETQQMCCLGFYGRSLGRTKSEMQGWGVLSSLPTPPPEWLRKHLDDKDVKRFKRQEKSTDVETVLADINDNRYSHPSRREAAIKYLFAKYGDIEVEFTGTYAEGTARAKRAVRRGQNDAGK